MRFKVYTDSVNEFTDMRELRFESDSAEEAESYKINLEQYLDGGTYAFIEEEDDDGRKD